MSISLVTSRGMKYHIFSFVPLSTWHCVISSSETISFGWNALSILRFYVAHCVPSVDVATCAVIGFGKDIDNFIKKNCMIRDLNTYWTHISESPRSYIDFDILPLGLDCLNNSVYGWVECRRVTIVLVPFFTCYRCVPCQYLLNE